MTKDQIVFSFLSWPFSFWLCGCRLHSLHWTHEANMFLKSWEVRHTTFSAQITQGEGVQMLMSKDKAVIEPSVPSQWSWKYSLKAEKLCSMALMGTDNCGLASTLYVVKLHNNISTIIMTLIYCFIRFSCAQWLTQLQCITRWCCYWVVTNYRCLICKSMDHHTKRSKGMK